MPLKVERTGGACRLMGAVRIESRLDDARVQSEAERILHFESQQRRDPDPRAPRLTVALGCEPRAGTCPQAHQISILPERIEIIGVTAVGCFLALQTLRQLLALHPGDLPCAVITDVPAFPLRGLLYDVTRGKVPTVATLKRLVDRLAALKCNQLQLYIEHAFTFAFDPDICDAGCGLTPDEIREVDAHARQRFITLVPAVATMGHMGRILSLPKYRHLAEIEPMQSWAQMSWPQRARGFTLDVLNPESMRLVERIWRDILDAFSSPVVNICGDEPHDLGRGRNAARLDDAGRASAYVRRIVETCRFVQSRGRSAQMWSDVLVQHLELLSQFEGDARPRVRPCGTGVQPVVCESGVQPEGRQVTDLPDRRQLGELPHPRPAGELPDRRQVGDLPLLPRDIAVLHWGYDAGSRYDMTRRFVEAGFPTVVCPGTTGWKRVLNAVALAERNITTFARAGLEAGATGLLNTDWGDHGHFNAPGCSAHGIALGAACGWSGVREPGGADFDRRFARWILGTPDAEIVALLRQTAAVADTCETWTLLRTPLDAMPDGGSLGSIEEWERTRDAAEMLIARLDDILSPRRAPLQDALGSPRHALDSPQDALDSLHGPGDARDLRIAAECSRVLAEKMLAGMTREPAVPKPPTRPRSNWASDLAAVREAYLANASVSFKPAGLRDIAIALQTAAAGQVGVAESTLAGGRYGSAAAGR
ncbi:MAG: family 20 glycosylhydrolase [Phycisphaerales bacterium]|nr:family 20 glycosylhydrolase [Phycisphaerales bacterium]